jgi:hypothetical protein
MESLDCGYYCGHCGAEDFDCDCGDDQPEGWFCHDCGADIDADEEHDSGCQAWA